MPLAFLASLCEGGGPAGPEGENCAIARNRSGCRKVLSLSRCGGSPLAEGAESGASRTPPPTTPNPTPTYK